MSEQANGNGSNRIQSGTAEGLLEWLDWVVARGYAASSAASPQKSAVRQVLTITEGDNFGSFDIKGVDLVDLLDRFAVRARGQLKAESIHSYRSRFTRAVETYREYLETGKPPRHRKQVKRTKSVDAAPPMRPKPSEPVPAAPVSSERLVDYPFPLQSGGLAHFMLPVRLEREDAERAATFIRALVFEPQKQLPAGGADRH